LCINFGEKLLKTMVIALIVNRSIKTQRQTTLRTDINSNWRMKRLYVAPRILAPRKIEVTLRRGDSMRNAVIVAAARTAVGKAPKGALRTTRPDELAAAVINAVIERSGIDKNEVEDIVLGCAFPEAEQGMNMARIVALRAGLPVTTAGQTVNRFCSSGLQSIATASQQIMAGMGDVIIAGGAESMSMVPMIGNKFTPNPYLASEYPGVYLGMGLTAENVAKQYGVSREDQDAFALRSHQRAAAAQAAGKFDAEIVPGRSRDAKVGEGSEVKEVRTLFKQTRACAATARWRRWPSSSRPLP
jgi:acetyl-CoA acyltransferase